MGGFIKAKCECGFETDFMGGSSRETMDTVCNAPAICLNCNTFLVLNYLSKDTLCPHCKGKVTFYDDSNLLEEDTAQRRSSFKADYFILPNVRCLCPKCKKKQMSFKHVGCWA